MVLTGQAHPDDIQAVVLMAPYVGDWDDLTRYQRQLERARKTVSAARCFSTELSINWQAIGN
jgi:hypothetical protein